MPGVDESTERVMHGRYEVAASRRSGMATIYEGVDRNSGRSVVIKVAPTADFDLSSALVREREVLVRLDHPGVVRCLDTFRERGNVAIVLEKISGHDLEEVLRLADVRIDEQQVRDWGAQLARILNYLHAQHPAVIYRDLKPSNIMCTPDHRLVLVDFGAARVLTPALRDTVPLGTPGYAAPEQYGALSGSSDERADLYALGVTLFELVTRRDPTPFGFSLPAPAELGVTVSPQFAAILRRATDPEPGRRYQSAAALLADLRPRRDPWPLVAAGLGLGAAGLALAGAAAGNLAGLAGLRGGLGGAAGCTHLSGAGAVVAAFACTTALTAWGRSDASSVVPPAARWRRHFPLVGFLAAMASLATLVWAVPDEAAHAGLRRLAFDLGWRAVPLQGPPLLTWGFVGWLALLGALTGSSRRRCYFWLVPFGLACLSAAVAGGLLVGAVQRDAQAPAAADVLVPAWQVAVDEPADFAEIIPLEHARRDPGPAAPGTDGPDHTVAALRSGTDGLRILDTQSGRVLWSARVPRWHRLQSLPGGMLCEVSERRVVMRALADGHYQGSYQTTAHIRTLWGDSEGLFLALEGGLVQRLDVDTRRPLWTWRVPCDHGPSEITMVSRGGEGLRVMAGYPDRVYTLGTSDGSVLASQKMPRRRRSGAPALQVGRWAVHAEAGGFTVTDPDSTTVLGAFHVAPSASGVAGPVGLIPAGTDSVYVQGDAWMGRVSLPDGGVQWNIRLDNVPASLSPVTDDRAVLCLASGRVLGLDARSGLVTWEYWGSPHLGAVGPFLFLQRDPHDDLVTLDPNTGRLVWRVHLRAGQVVRQLVDDGQHLLVLTGPPTGQPMTSGATGRFMLEGIPHPRR